MRLRMAGMLSPGFNMRKIRGEIAKFFGEKRFFTNS